MNPNWEPQRDTPRTVGNVRRSLGSMADSFVKGNEDTQTQQDVLGIERDVAALKRTALRELHSKYSDADLAEVLGRTRQAAFQMRTRAR